MFNNKKTQKIDQIDTVVGPGTKFQGNIEAIGIVRVDGFFNGGIVTQGDIIVGENGDVEGKLKARNIIIAGTSKANLICEAKLHIKSNGKVIGDVEVDSIVIEEKAVFQGQCLMRSEEKNQTEEVVNE